MGLGLDVRLSRLFSHASGNLFGIAVDHFVGYGNVRKGGLSNLPEAVARCVSAGPDTMTMTPGTAKNCWPPHVGKASLIVQASYWTPDDRIRDRLATPADAVRLGADARELAGVALRRAQAVDHYGSHGTVERCIARAGSASGRASPPLGSARS